MSVTAVPLQPTRRANVVMLWVGIVIAVLIAVWLALGASPIKATDSGLRYEVLKAGTGTDHPTDQDIALVRYTGRLTNGKVFDQSEQPVPMPVTGVIKGFSEGLQLMTKGAHYQFWMKPELAYGDKSPDPSVIPNNATLIFDVELVNFVNQDVLRQMQMQQMQQMMQGQGGAPAGGETPGQ